MMLSNYAGHYAKGLSIMSSIKDIALMATSITINVISRHLSSLFALFPSGKMGIMRFTIENC